MGKIPRPKKKVYCKNCRYYYSPNLCLLIEFFKRTHQEYYGISEVSAVEESLTDYIKHKTGKESVAPMSLVDSLSGAYSEGYPTEWINPDGECKYYIKKWWKFWVK